MFEAESFSGPFSRFRISDGEFTCLREFIYKLSGINIASNRKYLLQNRLTPRLRELGLTTFGEYYERLRAPENADELSRLFELVTTNETSFYRNPPQLEFFKSTLLSEMIAGLRKRREKRIRILSAGCSSGEEPYTLSILLHEVLGGDAPAWDLRITGLDISQAMLDLAGEGLYREYAVRTTPAPVLARYFDKEGDRFRVKDQVKNIVRFARVNLNDMRALSRIEPSTFIFCRNVIIYFDDDVRRRLAAAFYDNLLPGGCLLVGHSESLTGLSKAFVTIRRPGVVAYRREC